MTKLVRVSVVLGSVLLLLGVLAGVANREVLDGSRFAAHVDGVRTDPAVSRQLGVVITERITQQYPDLTIGRPLIESTVTGLVGSVAFGPAIRAMVVPAHQALTTSGNDAFVFRLADVGAVLAAALSTVAPSAAAPLPDDLDVTLATVGGRGFDGSMVKYAHLVKTLSWLLPALTLLCFGAAVALSRQRIRTLRSVGLAVAATGLTLGGAIFVAGVVASRVDTDTMSSAVAVASWNQRSSPLWSAAGLVTAAGYVLVWGLRLGGDPRGSLTRTVAWLARPPDTTRDRAAHGAILLAAGVAVLLRPVTAITVIAVAAGFVVALNGVTEFVAAVSRRGIGAGSGLRRLLRRTEIRAALIGVAAFAVLVALVAWNARSPQAAVAAVGSSTSSEACNGHEQLCGRRYDKVAFPATHNSMSAADEDGWFLAEQPTGIIGQLDDGIRTFLIDTWPGQETQREGLIATSGNSRTAALKQAEDVYGAQVLDSALRLRDASALTPKGPVEAYLCHALCELGATKWEPVMAEVKDWMDAHPREVVTFFIQDEVSPAETAKIFDRTGLLPMVYTPHAGSPWPTLRQMIDSGHRIVVLAENKGGGAEYPWILQGFDWVQDTAYDVANQSDFNCDLNRGSADSPLFLVNHWLTRPLARVSSSAAVNAAGVLGPRLDQCRKERGQIPNYVAVDYYNHGNLFGEVDRLNGFS